MDTDKDKGESITLPDLEWDSDQRYVFTDRQGREWIARCQQTVVVDENNPIEGRTELNWMLIRRDDPAVVQLMHDRDARLIFIDWRNV